MRYQAGDTAIIVPIPEAEPLVAASRSEHDPSAAYGVPAHVTLLYPYLRKELVTDEVRTELAAIMAASPAFEVTFADFGHFPATLYLAPEPAEPFRELTHAIWARWPEAPPSGGKFDEVIPHLTLAHEVGGETFDRVRRAVAPGLPFDAPVREAWLYAFDGTAWRPWVRLPLG